MKYTSLLIALLLIGVGMPMVLPGPGGEPIMSPRDWLPSQEALDSTQQQAKNVWQSTRSTTRKSGELLQGLAESTGIVRKGEDNTVYKWRDSEGNWHFSDKVPEGLSTETQSHEIKQLNSLPAVGLQSPEPESGEQPAQFSLPSPTTVSPKQVSQLIEDSKALQQKSKERQRALDNL